MVLFCFLQSDIKKDNKHKFIQGKPFQLNINTYIVWENVDQKSAGLKKTLECDHLELQGLPKFASIAQHMENSSETEKLQNTSYI